MPSAVPILLAGGNVAGRQPQRHNCPPAFQGRHHLRGEEVAVGAVGQDVARGP